MNQRVKYLFWRFVWFLARKWTGTRYWHVSRCKPLETLGDIADEYRFLSGTVMRLKYDRLKTTKADLKDVL